MRQVSRAQQKFSRLVAEWSCADRECSEAYTAWQVACRRREALAIKKNNAWGDLEMARAEATAVTNGDRGA